METLRSKIARNPSLAVVSLLVVVQLYYGGCCNQPVEPVEIDPELWKTSSYRKEVAPQLVASRQLIGLNKASVIRQLGPPDRDEGVFWYALNYPGEDLTDTFNLRVIFDRGGLVRYVHVRRKD